MEAMVEGSKLLVNGFIQQEVDVELDILCGKGNRGTLIIPLPSFTHLPSSLGFSGRPGDSGRELLDGK